MCQGCLDASLPSQISYPSFFTPRRCISTVPHRCFPTEGLTLRPFVRSQKSLGATKCYICTIPLALTHAHGFVLSIPPHSRRKKYTGFFASHRILYSDIIFIDRTSNCLTFLRGITPLQTIFDLTSFGLTFFKSILRRTTNHLNVQARPQHVVKLSSYENVDIIYSAVRGGLAKLSSM